MDAPTGTSSSDGLTVTTHCETPSAFIAALSPRSSAYPSWFPRSWIFRGLADDNFQLVPSALRNESKELSDLAQLWITNNKNQLQAEKRVLLNFLKNADSIGLYVPEDTQKLRRLLEDEIGSLDKWPPDEVLSLMALAQHHGVPTRLLDWSRHPLKAALFAASMASAAEDKSGRLSVWALSIAKLDMAPDNRPFTVVTAPSASNSNLRAQEGVFTIADQKQPNENPVERIPFDEILRKWIKRCNVKSPGPWFHRITLPQACAEQLCFDLALEGITHATLFPDFYGVVKAMKDMARWYDQGGPGRKRADDYAPSCSIEYEKEIPMSDLLKMYPDKTEFLAKQLACMQAGQKQTVN